MLNLNKCHPIELNDLIRIGSRHDGGYVLSKRIIDNTKLLLSFGINRDWNFEKDFYNNKECKIYAFDYSIKDLPFVTKKLAKIKIRIIYNMLRLKHSTVKDLRKQIELSKDFHHFFDNKKTIFIPKYLGEYDDEENICFDSIFKELMEKGVDDLSIFLKMDIELNEYLCLPQLIPYFDKLCGMVVEFHQLGIVDVRFEELLDAISTKFYIAHTHGNNYGNFIYKTKIPSTLEITFINKKLVDKTALSKRSYPIEGLDAPNNKHKDDLKLSFSDYE